MDARAKKKKVYLQLNKELQIMSEVQWRRIPLIRIYGPGQPDQQLMTHFFWESPQSQLSRRFQEHFEIRGQFRMVNVKVKR
jgi:hypothetical protein